MRNNQISSIIIIIFGLILIGIAIWVFSPVKTLEQQKADAYYSCVGVASVQKSKNITDCNLIK